MNRFAVLLCLSDEWRSLIDQNLEPYFAGDTPNDRVSPDLVESFQKLEL